MSELIEKPQQPAEYECCEAGCSPCVWDNYYEALKLWQEQEAKIKAEAAEGATSE